MIKGWKHIKPFIEAEPRIGELASSLNLRLFWREKTLWANGVQLTYEYRQVDGQMVPLDSVEQKAGLALDDTADDRQGSQRVAIVARAGPADHRPF